MQVIVDEAERKQFREISTGKQGEEEIGVSDGLVKSDPSGVKVGVPPRALRRLANVPHRPDCFQCSTPLKSKPENKSAGSPTTSTYDIHTPRSLNAPNHGLADV